MNTKNNLSGLLIVSALALGLASCNNSAVAPEFEPTLKSGTLGTISNLPILVSDEEAGILRMREEEKMAHDIYTAFSASFDQSIFGNIAESESSHYDAVGTLLTAYGLTDPSTGEEGTFTDAEIAELYSTLIASGSGSLTDALQTGALIEETDILDLQKLIAATTNPLILQVYSNLLSGSRNHLRSFVATLGVYGITYVPQLMNQDDFEAIINSPMETQKQNGTMNGNGSQNGKGKGKGNSNSSGNGNANKGSKGQNGSGNGTGVCING